MHRTSICTAVSTVAAALVFSAAPASAQDVAERPPVDPSVETVVTRGYWTAGDASGRFRVLEFATGWEAVRRRVVVEWLKEDAEEEAMVVAAAVDLGTLLDAAYSVSNPVLSQQGGAWHLTVRTSTRPMAQPTGRSVFVLGAPGKLRLLKPR